MPETNVHSFSSDMEIVFEDLSCKGYNFKGWYDSYGNPMPKIAVGTQHNITVYAKWEVSNNKVVFYYDNQMDEVLSESDKNKLENFTYTVCETKKLPVLHLTGYTFVGWSDADGNICSEIAAGQTGEKVFYAKPAGKIRASFRTHRSAFSGTAACSFV